MDQALAEAIQKNTLGRAPLSAVVDAGSYQLVQLEAPNVQPEEWRAAIRWRLRDVIDFPLEDATVDVFEIPEPARGAQAKMLYAVAARNEAVARVRDLLAPYARGFDVIDIPELCLRNLSALAPHAAKGVALLLLGEYSHYLVLTRNGVLYVTRRIDIRGRADLGAGWDKNAAHDSEASALALELQRSLDYFESHFDQTPIAEMLIAPGGARADALSQGLQREMGLSVRSFDLGECIDVAEGVPLPTGTLSLLATGAALRSAAART
jgi:MSHA biogenesis protein MshI